MFFCLYSCPLLFACLCFGAPQPAVAAIPSQPFTLGLGLCLVRAAPLLLVLGRLQGLVLLQGLASEGLPDPGVW